MKVSQNNKGSLSEYLAMKPGRQITSSVAKGSLMMLAPFAAATVLPTSLQGQVSCGAYTNGAISTNGTVGGCPDIYIDIDGDGSNDFNVFGGSSILYMYGVNGAVLGTSVGGYLYAGNASGTFSAGSFPASGSVATVAFPAGTGGNFAIPGGGFIPITFNGNLGWIEITIDAAGCITIGSFGVEDATGGTDGVGTVIAGDCLTLPVDLGAFDVHTKGSQVHLSWMTYSEINNQGFEIQRSTDGERFTKMDFVAGGGTTTEIKRYSFVDNDVKGNQTYYYRLKQVDYDGRFEFSGQVTAKIVSQHEVEVSDVYPNPASNNANMSISLARDQAVQIMVFDQMGKVITEQNHQLLAGNQTITIDLAAMSTGVYYVKTQINGETYYKKLFVD